MADPKVLGIVLAGGEGKRLSPLTLDRAKPAVPFGGLYRMIDFALSNLVNAGVLRIAVLTREGVSGATTRAIVAEAGTSLSVFHYCFDSKQELLDAVIKSLVGTNVGLAEATFEAGATRRQLIRSGLDAYWSHVTANPDTHLLTYELTQYCLRTPGYGAVARQPPEQGLLRLLQEVVAPGDRVPQRLLARRQVPCPAGQQRQPPLQPRQQRQG